jgi:hypothetical protein
VFEADDGDLQRGGLLRADRNDSGGEQQEREYRNSAAREVRAHLDGSPPEEPIVQI